MELNHKTPKELHKGRGKVNDYRDQLSRVYDAFFDAPMTMKEADKFCGVMRESICRYVRTLRLSRRIKLIGKRYCKVTKHLAGVYTTNPDFFPIDPQFKLPL
jgi:hypothetical protein